MKSLGEGIFGREAPKLDHEPAPERPLNSTLRILNDSNFPKHDARGHTSSMTSPSIPSPQDTCILHSGDTVRHQSCLVSPQTEQPEKLAELSLTREGWLEGVLSQGL